MGRKSNMTNLTTIMKRFPEICKDTEEQTLVMLSSFVLFDCRQPLLEALKIVCAHGVITVCVFQHSLGCPALTEMLSTIHTSTTKCV